MSGVQLVDSGIQVGKETKEVIDLLASLVNSIRNRGEKSYIDIGMEIMPQIGPAIEGMDKIAAEVGGVQTSETFAYLVDKVGDSLGK